MRPLTAAAALAAALVLAVPAGAATVSVPDQRGPDPLTFTAAPGERNDLSIVFAGDRYSVTDAGATLEPGERCRLLDDSGHRAECDPFAGDPPAIRADMGDESDLVRLGLPEQPPFTYPRMALVMGGPGDDRLEGSESGDTLLGGDGNDVLLGLGDGDSLGGDFGDDHLDGGDDLVKSGYTFDDQTPIAPGLGDTLAGGPGADTMRGGPGIADRVGYGGLDVGVRVTIDSVADDGAPGEGDLVATDVEAVTGTRRSDRITGSAAANGIVGEGGNDVLDGGGGLHDVIFPGPGNDVVYLRDGGREARGAQGPAPGSPVYDDSFACDYDAGLVNRDTVFADPGDLMSLDLAGCESLLFAGAPLRVSRGAASVLVDVVCPVLRGTRSCSGELELRVPFRTSAGAAGRPRPPSAWRVIGARSFTARSSRPRRIRVALSSAGRRLVAREGRVKAWPSVQLKDTP